MQVIFEAENWSRFPQLQERLSYFNARGSLLNWKLECQEFKAYESNLVIDFSMIII